MRVRRRIGALSLVCAGFLSVLSLAFALAVPGESNLGITDVKFEPISQGKNVLHVELQNTSEEEQTFAVHIYTRSPEYGRGGMGWGTPFFDTLKPNETKRVRHAFKIPGPITDATRVRLKFYNPDSPKSFDFEKPFEERRYASDELEHRGETSRALEPASESDGENVKKSFSEIQSSIRTGEYKEAWELFSKDYHEAEFQSRFETFSKAMSDVALFFWERDQFLELEPRSIGGRNDLIIMTAERKGEVWTLDFVKESGQWKLDWISGYVPRLLLWKDWEGRLLPAMEKRSTEHFDIFYFKGSTAARDIDGIAEQKEKGYKGICEYLGAESDVRIKLILFEDKQTKFLETGHQGAGWAFGDTMVEVYNDREKLGPYHETTHVLMRRYGNPPALFNEGFATYMQAGHRWEGERVHSTSAKLLRTGKLVPVEELLKRTEIGSQRDDGRVAYPESASFVGFIIETHGRDSFLKLYGQLQNRGERSLSRNIALISELLGAELASVESDWKAFLSGIRPE